MSGTTLRLRALSGSPLDEPAVREQVVASFRSLAAAAGVRVLAVETTGALLVVTIEAEAMTALGILTDLRRQTNVWFEERYKDGPLWGTRAPRS
ncbi:MAG: hypothetical protein ACOYN0_10925 [Phycisphaerales bacterium]